MMTITYAVSFPAIYQDVIIALEWEDSSWLIHKKGFKYFIYMFILQQINITKSFLLIFPSFRSRDYYDKFNIHYYELFQQTEVICEYK